ncbi:hypothetical protein DFH06DRAFT_302741 [Mycena polygramma]|nr:hypothetical protein DFH06DRAFT_302741 [Mycena polygramma]
MNHRMAWLPSCAGRIRWYVLPPLSVTAEIPDGNFMKSPSYTPRAVKVKTLLSLREREPVLRWWIKDSHSCGYGGSGGKRCDAFGPQTKHLSWIRSPCLQFRFHRRPKPIFVFVVFNLAILSHQFSFGCWARAVSRLFRWATVFFRRAASRCWASEAILLSRWF